MPRQRAIGTMHSKPPASRVRAISRFFSQVGSKLVSASVIAQAFEQLEPKIPSLSLLSLNSGLPAARNESRLPISFALLIYDFRLFRTPGSGRARTVNGSGKNLARTGSRLLQFRRSTPPLDSTGFATVIPRWR